jgi:hypothetical protein
MKDAGGWLFLALVVVVIAYLAGITDTKWWYSNYLSVKDDSKIVIEKKPHDCEFMTAPLGRKNCHYDKVVATVKWGMSAGKPVQSFDEGKTWYAFTPDAT